jgi:hypothetical protein
MLAPRALSRGMMKETGFLHINKLVAVLTFFRRGIEVLGF